MLKSLQLKNFRNYKQAELSFSPKINLFVGNNAQGKTNLLEALFLISTGRSFRTPRLTELIHEEANYFYLSATFEKKEIEQSVSLYFDGKTRKLELNKQTHTRFAPLIGLLPTVLWSPRDHALIDGSPGERRRFLDLHISQSDPLYLYHLARYYKALKQRNVLLRNQSIDAIESWEEHLATSATHLMNKRKQTINDLLEPLAHYLNTFSAGTDKLGLAYAPSFHSTSSLIEQLLAHRPRELETGSTSHGPHRDDLHIHINQKQARHFSSEGQKRSIVASLHFAEYNRLKALLEEPPIFSIDDFGMHLDPERQSAVSRNLKTLNQVFLTSPSQQKLENTKTFHIESGTLSSSIL